MSPPIETSHDRKRGHRPPLGHAISHERMRTELGATPPLAQAPEQATAGEQTGERRANGTFKKGSRTAQSRGGRASRLARRLVRRLGYTRVTCPSWLRAQLPDATEQVRDLMTRYPDPALEGLILVVVCAQLRALASGDASSPTEARGWSREYRACLRELAALGALATPAAPSKADQMRARVDAAMKEQDHAE